MIALGLFERAIPGIETTIELSTTKAQTQDGLFLKATSISGMGRFEEAIVVLQASLDAQPSGPLAPLLRSRIETLTMALAAEEAGP